MTNKQDITVFKSQLEPEKALKERHQQHRATPCVGNAPLSMKPQRGVIRLISFDYALTGLNDIAHPRFAGRCPALMITPFQGLAFARRSFRRALPSIINVL
jgi:hypothetical protein